MAQPTWLEMHSVPRSGSGMYTVSMPCTSSMRSIHLRVPSLDTCSVTISGTEMLATSLKLRAKVLRQIGHGGEIRRAAPVDPLHQLARAKRLRAERSATNASSSARGKPK
jgi:hypothetical protein